MLKSATIILPILIYGISYSDAIQCHGATPTHGKLNPPIFTAQCEGPNFDDICSVMFTDYDNDNLDAWTFGCLIKGSLNQCNKSFKSTGVTNNYCCCTTPDCNTMDFARKCGTGCGSGGKSNGSPHRVQMHPFLLLSMVTVMTYVM